MATDNQARITDLKAKIKARDGKPGFAENVEYLRQELEKAEKGE